VIGWPEAEEESAKQSLRTALTSLRQVFGTGCVEADRRMVRLVPEHFDIDVAAFRSGRNPEIYSGRLLDGSDWDWALAYALELEDAYFQLVLERMDELPAPEATVLAREALGRDPSRLDVRAKLRELGSATELAGAPFTATPFIGRERELAEITELLRANRLVTLTGPGGSGKTRLAAELWRRHQPDAWFVALANLSDPEGVAEEMRTALRVPGSPIRGAIEQIAFTFGNSEGLLVVDNFEHVIEVAPLLVHLLSECRALRVLVTSQLSLGLPQEVEYPVGALSLDESGGELSEGCRLFVSRARAANPRFQADSRDVRRLCTLLDGYPLALEIAAAKSRLMSPAEMIDQLDDRFEFLRRGRGGGRHASLRNALDWTFERLPGPAQDLVGDLTVFKGGFTLESVQAVCGTEGCLDAFEYLCANAWVEPYGQGRFRALESFREYGAEILPPRRLNQLRRSHANHFMGLVRECHDTIFAPNEQELHKRVETDIHNLDVAWEWLRDNDPEIALEFVTSLNWFWIQRGHWAPALSRLERVLETIEWHPRPRLIHAFQCKANYLFWQGHQTESIPWFEKARAMSKALDHVLFEAHALMQLGQVHAELGEYDLAAREAEEGTRLTIQDGNPNWIGAGYVVRSLVANRRGALNEALEMGLLGVAYCREGGYPWGVASALNELAMAYHQLGRYEESLQFQEESIATKRASQSLRSLALSLVDLAATYAECGRAEEADEPLKEGLAIQTSLGIVEIMPRLFTTAFRLFQLRGETEKASVCLGAAKTAVAVPERWHAHLHGEFPAIREAPLNSAIELIQQM
jgi:predicted ATPase